MAIYTHADSTFFDGVPYRSLSGVDIEPAGTVNGEPYWRFGLNGDTRVFGLKQTPKGSYVGFGGDGVPFGAAPGLEPYSEDQDVQMIPYVDPTEAVLASLPFGSLADSAMADMTFVGEMSLPGISGGGSGEHATPVISSSAPTAGASVVSASLNPWVIVALVVVAFLLFQQE